MNYILFDDSSWENLLPLTFTRPVSEIRIGILKISEKWQLVLNTEVSYLTKEYLSVKYNKKITNDNILINGSILPFRELIDTLSNIRTGQVIMSGNTLLAARSDNTNIEKIFESKGNGFDMVRLNTIPVKIEYPWDIFTHNEKALHDDFLLLTKGRKSQPISNTNRITGEENIFVEQGATIECSVINAKNGPIYIGKNTEIMEGALIRGPLALCEHSVIKLGAKIYGATTIGPHSKIGGEINNSVIFGYSNKAHDGFLGNSVLGEWCNLGADTNNSNLKNNYAIVKAWNYPQERFINTNHQFCGLIMGDHSKSGINTMFNTGTVVGISANIYGAGFPRNFVPSFSWGGPQGMTIYALNKAYTVAHEVMKRRNIEFTDADKHIFETVFDKTAKYRHF